MTALAVAQSASLSFPSICMRPAALRVSYTGNSSESSDISAQIARAANAAVSRTEYRIFVTVHLLSCEHLPFNEIGIIIRVIKVPAKEVIPIAVILLC